MDRQQRNKLLGIASGELLVAAGIFRGGHRREDGEQLAAGSSHRLRAAGRHFPGGPAAGPAGELRQGPRQEERKEKEETLKAQTAASHRDAAVSYYSPIKIRYFNGNRRALRVGAFPKNPTRRWRYQNKTIVLFFMDSSIRIRFSLPGKDPGKSQTPPQICPGCRP